MTGSVTDQWGRGMWRYADRLPACAPGSRISLGEGDTPVVDLQRTFGVALGISSLVAKAEDRNPTGSFKARIASVAYSLVRDRGLAGTIGTSSGNGGAAAAAYAAAAGSSAVLFTLSDTVPAKMREIAALGGIVTRVRGVGHDAASTRDVADYLAGVCADHGFLPMLTAFHYAPEAMHGIKTIAFELAVQVPDLTALYVPVGGGGLLAGLHLGYLELVAEGRVQMPRLIGVQPAGSAALARAVAGHPEGIEGRVETTISGLQMATLFDTELAVAAVTTTGGHVVTVSDEQVWATQAALARRQGLLVEPAGATALAGVVADEAVGGLSPADRIGVIFSGAGYKDVASLDRLAGAIQVPAIEVSDVASRLAGVLAGLR